MKATYKNAGFFVFWYGKRMPVFLIDGYCCIKFGDNFYSIDSYPPGAIEIDMESNK